MEAIINGIIVGFTFLAIILVEMVMGKQPLTKKEVSDYQKILDEMDAKAQTDYNLVWKHDAAFELMNQRKQNKSFVLTFSGMFIALTFIILACLTTFLSLLNIGIACASGIILFCYGLIKMADSKKLAIGVLLFIFIIGTLSMFAFDRLMAMSPFAYAYFCGLILVLGVFSFINNARQSKLK